MAIVILPMLMSSVYAFPSSTVVTKILGEAQESAPVQMLCKTINIYCHDKCKYLDGLKETVCFSGCVTAEQLRKIPLSVRTEVIDPIAQKIDSYFIGRMFGAVASAAGLGKE